MRQRYRDAALVCALLLVGALIALDVRRAGMGGREEIEALEGAYVVSTGTTQAPELHARASALLREGRAAQADSVYRQIVARHPEEIAGHMGLGSSRFFQGDLQGAEQAYRAALALDSASAHALIGIAGVQYRRDNYAEALVLYRRAAEYAPDSPDAHWGLAVTYDALGQAADAVREFEEFLRLAPRSGFAPNARARLAELRGG